MTFPDNPFRGIIKQTPKNSKSGLRSYAIKHDLEKLEVGDEVFFPTPDGYKSARVFSPLANVRYLRIKGTFKQKLADGGIIVRRTA